MPVPRARVPAQHCQILCGPPVLRRLRKPPPSDGTRLVIGSNDAAGKGRLSLVDFAAADDCSIIWEIGSSYPVSVVEYLPLSNDALFAIFVDASSSISFATIKFGESVTSRNFHNALYVSHCVEWDGDFYNIFIFLECTARPCAGFISAEPSMVVLEKISVSLAGILWTVLLPAEFADASGLSCLIRRHPSKYLAVHYGKTLAKLSTVDGSLLSHQILPGLESAASAAVVALLPVPSEELPIEAAGVENPWPVSVSPARLRSIMMASGTLFGTPFSSSAEVKTVFQDSFAVWTALPGLTPAVPSSRATGELPGPETLRCGVPQRFAYATSGSVSTVSVHLVSVPSSFATPLALQYNDVQASSSTDPFPTGDGPALSGGAVFHWFDWTPPCALVSGKYLLRVAVDGSDVLPSDETVEFSIWAPMELRRSLLSPADGIFMVESCNATAAPGGWRLCINRGKTLRFFATFRRTCLSRGLHRRVQRS